MRKTLMATLLQTFPVLYSVSLFLLKSRMDIRRSLSYRWKAVKTRGHSRSMPPDTADGGRGISVLSSVDIWAPEKPSQSFALWSPRQGFVTSTVGRQWWVGGKEAFSIWGPACCWPRCYHPVKSTRPNFPDPFPCSWDCSLESSPFTPLVACCLALL